MKFKPNDIFVILQPTSPLRNQKQVLKAIKYLIENPGGGCRSVTSIKNQTILVDFEKGIIEQYGKNNAVTENGNFFIFTMPDIMKYNCISGNVNLAPVSSSSPFNDIDTKIDFEVVKMFMEKEGFLEDFYKESLI